MQEHDGEHAPVLVVHGDVGRHERRRGARVCGRCCSSAPVASSTRKTATLMAIRTLVTGVPALPHHAAALPAAAGLLAGDDLGAPAAAPLLGHAVGAAKADRGRDHALVADRPAAVGAAHAGLAVGVAVAVLDVEIVGHVQLEVLDGRSSAHDGGRHSCARATSSAIQPSMRTGLMVVARRRPRGACRRWRSASPAAGRARAGRRGSSLVTRRTS